GPWFNRRMRQELGLPAAEQRLGEAAHDFVSLLGAPQVYLSRACKRDGVPTVPSRWLIRLQVLLEAGSLAEAGSRWLAWAEQRNRSPAAARPLPAPEPRPALALRPRRRKMAGQSLRHLCRAHPRPGTAAGSDAHARCRPARPDRARRAQPLRAPLPRCPPRGHRRRTRRLRARSLGRAHGLAAGC